MQATPPHSYGTEGLNYTRREICSVYNVLGRFEPDRHNVVFRSKVKRLSTFAEKSRAERSKFNEKTDDHSGSTLVGKVLELLAESDVVAVHVLAGDAYIARDNMAQQSQEMKGA